MDTILHLGAHRTATTGLQRYLEGERAALRRTGIAVWTPERTRTGLFDGILGRPGDFAGQGRATARIRRELARAEAEGVARIIVSEENMIGNARANLRRGTLYGDIGPRLRALGPAFADRTDRVALTIRSYGGYWSSVMAFAALRGEAPPLGPGLDRLVTQPRRWRDVIADVAAAFPRADVVVMLHEHLAPRPDLQTAVLCPELPPPVALPTLAEVVNPGPRGPRLARALLALGVAEADLPRGDGRWMPFTRLQRAAFRAAYQDDLDWLAGGASGIARLAEPVHEVKDNGRMIRANRAPLQIGGRDDDRGYATG